MRHVVRRVASFVLLLHAVVVWGSLGCRVSEEEPIPPLERFEFSEPHMGSPVRIVLWAPDRRLADEAASAAFAAVAAIDAALSDYRADSETNRLAAEAGHGPRRVSADMVRVLERAREISEATRGAFDVTAGPLVALWREARRTGRRPGDEALRAARSLVGYRRVEIDATARAVRLAAPGMRLDFGGIGKGYACDRALETLAARGVRRALVEAGGDIALGEAPPGAAGWRVEAPGGGVIVAARRGISTSGDAEQFAWIDGVRHSHVVDPRTGLALQHVSTVTVIAPDATTSDAFATGLGVLARDEAIALAESIPDLEARFRLRDGAEIFSTVDTSAFVTEP